MTQPALEMSEMSTRDSDAPWNTRERRLVREAQLSTSTICNRRGDVESLARECCVTCVVMVVDNCSSPRRPPRILELSGHMDSMVLHANRLLRDWTGGSRGHLSTSEDTPLHPQCFLHSLAGRVVLFVIPPEALSVRISMDYHRQLFTLSWSDSKQLQELLEEPLGGEDEDVPVVVIHPVHSSVKVDGRVRLNTGAGAAGVVGDLHLSGAVYCRDAWISPSTPLSTFSLHDDLQTRLEEDAEEALMRAAREAFGSGGSAERLLLPGERVAHRLSGVEHLVHGKGVTAGVLLLTSYRLLFTSLDRSSYEDTEDDHTSLPLASIFRVSKVGAGASLRFLEVSCNNFKISLFGLPRHSKARRRLREHVAAAGLSPFAMHSAEAALYPHRPFDIRQEYARILGSSLGSTYRIVDNTDYHICDTYPSYLVAPSSIDESCLLGSAQFRTKQRLPAVTWRHPVSGAVITRCSQPKAGIKKNRSADDERLIGAVRHGKHLYMIDSRPVASVMANKMIGGGHESADAYQGVKLHFIGIGNIHVMREAWSKLRTLCRKQGDDLEDDQWMAQLQSTNWLLYIKQIMAGASLICSIIDKKQTSVATHCSDGWDRSSQLCALAQLMLDAHYRTFEGFVVLIQKEFLAFGHKFASRHSAQDEQGTKAPIFLMFLDCVHQMVSQRQDAFEFNQLFLAELVHHSYSKRFGTFLFDSERERKAHKVEDVSPCLFAYLRSKKDSMFCNPTYRRDPSVIYPETRVRYLRLWYQVYLGESVSSQVSRLRRILQWKAATLAHSAQEHQGLTWGDVAHFY